MNNLKERNYHGGNGSIKTVAIITAVAGVIAGAAIVIVGTMAMNNDENRAKMKNILDSMKSKITDSEKNISSKVESGKNQVEKIFKGSKKVLKKASKKLATKKNKNI